MAKNTTPRPANSEAANYVERIESLNHNLDNLRSEHMIACKAVHEDKKQVLKEAKLAGFAKAAVKAVVAARAAERKAKQAREGLGGTDQDTFDQIRHALGDLAETPLGQAATRAAA